MMLSFSKQFCCFAFVSFFAFFLSSCADIDKGLYDLTNRVSSVDRVTGERSLNFYNREDQIKQSNAQVERLIAQNYVAQNKPINEKISIKDYKRLKDIFKRVHQVSHMRDEDWDVILIPEDSFNAFVTGGTYVIVHHGLMKTLTNDDELAYVLGHEIAHVAADHVYETQSYNVGAMLAGSKSARRESFQTAFTHENEVEADKVGLLYSTLAGYNPEKAALSWDRMGEQFGYHGTTFSTHPIAIERASNLRKLADVYKQYYMPGKINPNYTTILRTNPVFGRPQIQQASMAPGEGAGIGAFLGTVLSSFSTKQEAKQEEARQAQRIAFIKKIQDNLRLINRLYVDEHTVKVTFKYIGTDIVQNLAFRAGLRDKIAIGKTDSIVKQNDYFDVSFKFTDILIDKRDVNQLAFALDYAESY